MAKYKNRTTGVSSTAAKYASAFCSGSGTLKAHYPQFCNASSPKRSRNLRFRQNGVLRRHANRQQPRPYFYEDNYIDDMELVAAQLFRHSNGPVNFLKEAIYCTSWGLPPPDDHRHRRHYQWYPFVEPGHSGGTIRRPAWGRRDSSVFKRL